MIKNRRIRLFELMNYDEYWKPNKAIDWLNKVNCKYLAVVHDKDVKEDGTPKATHYHVVVNLKDARTIEDISKNCDIEKQYIEVKKSFNDSLAYCFHITSKAREDHKHEYGEDAVLSSKDVSVADIFKRGEDYVKKVKHDKEIKQLLFQYGNCEITKSQVLQVLTAEDYDKYGLTFRKMKEYRIMKVREREMNVIYITGSSGSGKTTLAKYMAKTMNYDFFVSGSGKDVLDGYDKEECIILDDLRADVFTKAELFKLTDNNTNSSVKSRFQNKDISYCKLMIITSIKAPHDLYNWNEDIQETFKQFARRLNNHFIYCDNDGSIVDKEYTIDGKIKGVLCDFNMSQVFHVLGIEKVLGAPLMKQIFAKINEEVKSAKDKHETIEEIDDLPF